MSPAKEAFSTGKPRKLRRQPELAETRSTPSGMSGDHSLTCAYGFFRALAEGVVRKSSKRILYSCLFCHDLCRCIEAEQEAMIG